MKSRLLTTAIVCILLGVGSLLGVTLNGVPNQSIVLTSGEVTAACTTCLLSGDPVIASTYSTATNCSSGASPAACGSAAAGAVAIPTGVTSVTLQVNTTAVTASSEIFLSSDDTLTISATTCNSTLATLVGGLVVTARNPGVSFTITYNGTIATNKLCVAYEIKN